MRLLLTFLGLVALGGAARGQYGMAPIGGDEAPEPPALTIEPHFGARVPADLTFQNEHGEPVRLGDLIGGKPTVLVLAYYRCPQLCNQVLNGLLDAMRAMNLDCGTDYNVITVSFDPKEAPALAWKKKQGYVREYGRPGAEGGWHFLTGKKDAIDALAETVGFQYQYEPKTKVYYHPAGVMVLTPEGTIARYFYGIQYRPGDLRFGLIEASGGEIGTAVDGILLTCFFHYDEATGRYKQVMSILGVAGGITVLVMALVVYGAFRRARRDAAAAAQEAAQREAAGAPPAGV